MAIYCVHMRADQAEALERAQFVKQGFAFWALVLGPFWLLGKRLWRALALWGLCALPVAIAAGAGVLREGAAVELYLLGALYLGLDGRRLEGAALTRGGAPLADVVAGEDAASAELGFFSRWLRAEAPPASAPPRAAGAPIAPTHIIGLFPEAGS